MWELILEASHGRLIGVIPLVPLIISPSSLVLCGLWKSNSAPGSFNCFQLSENSHAHLETHWEPCQSVPSEAGLLSLASCNSAAFPLSYIPNVNLPSLGTGKRYASLSSSSRPETWNEAVGPKAALQLDARSFKLQSRVSSFHPGTYAVTQQKPPLIWRTFCLSFTSPGSRPGTCRPDFVPWNTSLP